MGYKVKAFVHPRQPASRALDRRAGRHQRRQELPERRRQRVIGLFYDTVKGGDYRAREANVYPSRRWVNIIDQCVAQGVPFAREYGGLLANRSFGGAQVARTFYARGQTGQQLLLGAYRRDAAWSRRAIEMYTRHEMLDLVVVDGIARGIITRNLVHG